MRRIGERSGCEAGPSGQVFQASFTRRYSAKEAICVGEDDVNKAAPHGTQTAKPQETHGTGISLPSPALKGTASATVSLASDVRGIEHSPGSSMEDENVSLIRTPAWCMVLASLQNQHLIAELLFRG